jgi:hypothetical protein
MTRADVEHAIADEEALLARVAALIVARTPLARWPEEALVALALALDERGISAPEVWKATALRRHLFGPGDPPTLDPPVHPTDQDRRHADRLRGDLIALVPLRALQIR